MGVPFPEFKYPILSMSPIRAKALAAHEHFTTAEIVTDLFQGKNILCSCDEILPQNRYLSAVVLLRGVGEPQTGAAYGNPIAMNEAREALTKLICPRSSHRTPIRFHPMYDKG